jgi:hypothetical protein
MKVKKKAIHAELRKESKTFDGWLKYEITIQSEDGSVEKVPAYGKDLQDALSRVVHDEKVENILPVVKKVPDYVWVILWFIGNGFTIIQILNHQKSLGGWTGLIFIGSILALTTFSLTLANFFRLKNVPR